MRIFHQARRYQRGYLLEVPLLMAVVGIATALLWGVLPTWAAEVLLGCAVLVGIGGLYYMWAMPGRQPGNVRRRQQNGLRVWIGVALLILLGWGLVLLVSAGVV